MIRNQPIRVLHVVTELNIGGIQSFLLNLCKSLDRSKVVVDFLLSTEEPGSLEPFFRESGSKIYRVIPKRKSILGNRRDLDSFFSEHAEYQCVHCHMSNYSYIEPLVFAKKHGVPMRIIHSHSTSLPKGAIHHLLHLVNKPIAVEYATDYYACSDLAADWLFGGTGVRDRVQIVNNGIFLADYRFDEGARKGVRDDLGVNDRDRLIVLLGNMRAPKNHRFALSLTKQLLSFCNDYKLVLIGDGPDFATIAEVADKLDLGRSTIFLGQRNDCARLLQGMDLAIMPSLFEGFPVALLEEQAAGLPCFVSCNVTEQAKINPNVFYLPLDAGEKEWAELINRYFEEDYKRCCNQSLLAESGFTIESVAEWIQERYLDACNK